MMQTNPIGWSAGPRPLSCGTQTDWALAFGETTLARCLPWTEAIPPTRSPRSEGMPGRGCVPARLWPPGPDEDFPGDTQGNFASNTWGHVHEPSSLPDSQRCLPRNDAVCDPLKNTRRAGVLRVFLPTPAMRVAHGARLFPRTAEACSSEQELRSKRWDSAPLCHGITEGRYGTTRGKP